jgi:hypothetical protein
VPTYLEKFVTFVQKPIDTDFWFASMSPNKAQCAACSAEPKQTIMRVYPDIDVELTYQNFGSSWLVILRGSTENIERVFLGLWNLGATQGELEYKDHLQTVARFWSDEKNMRRFFMNQIDIPLCTVPHKKKETDRVYKTACIVADAKMKVLRETSHEFFLNHRLTSPGDVYDMGVVCAEKPDVDMKDAIINNAYRDKEHDAGHQNLTHSQAFA